MSTSSSNHPKVSFFTPGRRLPHKDSYTIIDQSYVHYRPAYRTAPIQRNLPILFIHGGGLSGAQWEATPDLRPGWLCLASDMGYDAYLLDTVDNGRSARAPVGVRGDDAELEYRTAKEMWLRFRFGPLDKFEEREVYPTSQFPVEHLDSLVASQTPRRRSNDEVEARGIAEVLKIVGECLVIAHSHGAALLMDMLGTFELRDSVLDNVKRMALVEPGGTSNAQHLRGEIPTLVVWGDYIDEHEAWPEIARPFDNCAAQIMRLPDVGIHGNSHFPMSDKNSDEVYKVIEKWLDDG